MKKIEIDPVVYGWCRSHGYSVLDPEAESEFDIWCSEIDAMKEIDVNDDGDYEFVYGYDIAEDRWLREMEMEDEILHEEFYDSYAEFLAEEYPAWQDDLYEESMVLDGLDHLAEAYEQLKHVLGGHVLFGVNEGIAKEMVCNAFLREAYEAEVLNHRGLDDEKIEMYNNICRSFMWSKHGPQPRIKKGETND